MDVHAPTALLGGLSPAAFMRRHWQKKPLLVRQAIPGAAPPIPRAALLELAARDDVESRLVVHDGGRWSMRRGPLPRRALPSLRRPGWTLLVQGLDLHAEAAHGLLNRFRFVPDARLDDLMLSYATDRGGVGPHLDSYDVFLLQVHGRRRWRIGRVPDATLVDGLPLKILARFEAEDEWLLEPGDMLYLPPRWGHDGMAEGECMTCSIGFRAPSAADVAHDVLQRVVEGIDAGDVPRRYRDPAQRAAESPARLPAGLQAFAATAIERLLRDPRTIGCALGETLTEPKPQVWFDGGKPLAAAGGVRLDRRSRMMYDAAHVFLNGESFVAGGRDARLMQRLADQRMLAASDVARLGEGARDLLDQWARAGWLHRA